MNKALLLTLVTLAVGLTIANSNIESVTAQAPHAGEEDASTGPATIVDVDMEVDEASDAGWIESWTGIKAFRSGKCGGKSHRNRHGSCTSQGRDDDDRTESTGDTDQNA